MEVIREYTRVYGSIRECTNCISCQFLLTGHFSIWLAFVALLGGGMAATNCGSILSKYSLTMQLLHFVFYGCKYQA